MHVGVPFFCVAQVEVRVLVRARVKRCVCPLFLLVSAVVKHAFLV